MSFANAGGYYSFATSWLNEYGGIYCLPPANAGGYYGIATSWLGEIIGNKVDKWGGDAIVLSSLMIVNKVFLIVAREGI